jgi:hypothetical protein
VSRLAFGVRLPIAPVAAVPISAAPIGMAVIRVTVWAPIITRRVIGGSVIISGWWVIGRRRDRDRYREPDENACLRLWLAKQSHGKNHRQHEEKLFHITLRLRRLPRMRVTASIVTKDAHKPNPLGDAAIEPQAARLSVDTSTRLGTELFVRRKCPPRQGSNRIRVYTL